MQAIASIILLMRFSGLFLYPFNSFILTIGLLLKIAAAPLHNWMPALVEGLTWENIFLLLTIQKIAPLIVISINFPKKDLFNLFLVVISLSALVGRIRGLRQSSIRKILTFSSIRHLSWILTALLIHKSLWLRYFLVYTLISLSIVLTLKIFNVNKLSKIFKAKHNQTKLIIINFLSLRGLPPFTGFFPKIIVVIKTIPSTFTALLVPLLVGSLIRMFFYLRVSIISIFWSTGKPNTIKRGRKKNITALAVNIMGLRVGVGLVFIVLDFKLKKLWTFKVQNKHIV